MIKILPKVTRDLNEYSRLTGRYGLMIDRYTNGLYFNGVIWVVRLSPKVLLHEFVHHIIGHSNDVKYIAPRLLGDFLNTLWDVAYFRLTHFRTSVYQRREAIRRLKEDLREFLDWIFCRNGWERNN